MCQRLGAPVARPRKSHFRNTVRRPACRRHLATYILLGRPAFTDFALRSITGFRGKLQENARPADVPGRLGPEVLVGSRRSSLALAGRLATKEASGCWH